MNAREHYRATKDTHRLCRRCQLIQTADPDQVCGDCRGRSNARFVTHSCPRCGDVHLSRDSRPDPSWTEDADGYVVAPLVNRGILDAD